MGAQGAKNVDSGNEWATPKAVVEEAAEFLAIKEFDLDPAATNENKKARNHFDRESNGLEQEWFGNVWLNPPFSRSLKACVKQFGDLGKCTRKTCRERGQHLEEDQDGAVDFAMKVVKELESGRVKSVAWHGPVAPDTDWFALLWPFVVLRIDYGQRIKYNGGINGGTFPSQTMLLKPERKLLGSVPCLLLPVPTDQENESI